MTQTDFTTAPQQDESLGGSSERMLLVSVLAGTWLSQAAYAVAKLGVADELVGGPRHVDDLAERVGANPDALHRMLRALTPVGIFEETDERTFALNPTASLLRDDAPQSARMAAVMYGEEVVRSFAEIMHTARTGEPAFDHVYGRSFYEYLEANPQANRTFNTAMGGLREVPVALETCDLGDVGSIVDVGGGNGNLIAHVLQEHSGMRGILLELPEAIRQARDRLAEASVSNRCELITGSFFDEIPSGADVYVLSRCLHNWDDEHALQILRRVRAAAGDGARLIVLEKLIPPGSGFSPAKLVDLLMLVMVRGRDRTEQEYRHLLAQSDFDVRDVRAAPVSDPRAEHVIEAVAARA